MADFSLTTVFVVPSSYTALASSGSTQDLAAGQLGIFDNNYAITATPSTAKYFYVAQGRENTYLLGSKRSDKIKGCVSGYPCNSNVTEWYKVTGCPTPVNQITNITNWDVKCGDIITITLRAHSSYIDTLYFNGLTRSITVQAPCCDCGADPCDQIADLSALIDLMVEKFGEHAPGINPDNTLLTDFFTFENIGGTVLRITGKALTKLGVPCDIAANPHEYDRLWFRSFVYAGPATTADFIVSDACNIVAESTVAQTSNYASGTYEEIYQLEKNYYTYQAGYLKHLYRMAGYNQNFESYAESGRNYTTYYIKFNELDRSAGNWGDFVPTDSMVIIAAVTGSAFATALESVLENALGTVADKNTCITTTTTSTVAPTTTTTTTAG